MKRHLVWFIPFALSTACLLGCGENIPLKGKVTYEDGTPITKGTVNFTTDTQLSRGKIQSDGSYVVGTAEEKDGLPPGTYKIYITGAEEPIEAKSGPERRDSMGNVIQAMSGYQQLVGREYMRADTTPLKCDVPAPQNTYDIVIPKPSHLK